MRYEDIKGYSQRCEEHPDHQSGMVTNSMIVQRSNEEIGELRMYIEQAESQKPVAWRKKVNGVWHYFDKSTPFPFDDCEPLYEKN